jgi:uncharacterized LabA/DUF88 family protein
MNTPPRTALLIDADNVSTEIAAQVLERLAASGHLLLQRRAYGSVQKAGEFAEFCREHAIRFLPSTFAGPNATDIALAIDAVEMVLRQPLDEVVLVSSDMDYSPLIVRLRELGCRVTGYGQLGKSGSDIARDYKRVYDDFDVIGPVVKTRARAAAVPTAAANSRATRAAPAAPAKAAALTPAPAPAPAPAKRAAAKTPRAARPAKSVAVAQAAAPVPVSLPPEVEAVLQACPELRQGRAMRLNAAGKSLHDSGVLPPNGRPSALFKRLGAHFEMLPADKPEQVRFVG